MIEIKLYIDRCRCCPHVTNSAIEHDDPFTSTSINIRWWCKIDNHTIRDENMIDPSCFYK